jgi:hypothetical protein
MYRLFIDLNTVCVSGHHQHVNVAIQFSKIIKRVKVNTICLAETYRKVRTVEHLSDSLVFRMV